MIKLFKSLKSWKELRRINQDLLIENASLTRKLDDMTKRLRRAGSLPYEYFEDENVTTVCAESKPFGLYAIVNDDEYEKVIEKTKVVVVKNLAQSLIDMNLVQIIVKNAHDDPFSIGHTTVAAKLQVIPWEQMVRKIQLFPKVEEQEKEKGKDNDLVYHPYTGAGVFAPVSGRDATLDTSITTRAVGLITLPLIVISGSMG